MHNTRFVLTGVSPWRIAELALKMCNISSRLAMGPDREVKLITDVEYLPEGWAPLREAMYVDAVEAMKIVYIADHSKGDRYVAAIGGPIYVVSVPNSDGSWEGYSAPYLIFVEWTSAKSGATITAVPDGKGTFTLSFKDGKHNSRYICFFFPIVEDERWRGRAHGLHVWSSAEAAEGHFGDDQDPEMTRRLTGLFGRFEF